jgi:hypothetical protein
MDFHEHSQPLEITFEGIHSWYRSLFKRSGWLILALRDGYIDKIKNFREESEHLLQAVKLKEKLVEEKDRKDDLKIIENNIKTLIKHISKY